MSELQDDSITKTRTEQLISQLKGQVKQHIILNSVSDKRPKFIFTAPINAKNGEPCMCTEYVYIETDSTVIIKRQERDYRWKSAWEAGSKPFTFDPTVDYDLDGDGYL